MKRLLVAGAMALGMLGLPAAASAQSGHFVVGGANAPTCRDIGTQVACSGKVAGLGGTTFEITVQAQGIASVQCYNPAGNRAPGQDTSVNVSGTTTPLPTPRNGQYVFSLTSDAPSVPATPTCPNPKWTPVVTDVRFTTATLTLLEDGAVSDQVTVPVT